jgi:hypothetical protein
LAPLSTWRLKPPPGKQPSFLRLPLSAAPRTKAKSLCTSLLCQQSIVHTSATEYQIRQQKPKSMDIIPPSTPIEFTVNKDKLKFTANGKKYEFLIVGTTALGANSQ